MKTKFGVAFAGFAAGVVGFAGAVHAVPTNMLTCSFNAGGKITATGVLPCTPGKIGLKIAGDAALIPDISCSANAATADLLAKVPPFGLSGTGIAVLDGFDIKGSIKGYGDCNLALPDPAAYLPSGKVSFQFYSGAVKVKAKSDAWAIVSGVAAVPPYATLDGAVIKGLAVGSLVHMEADIDPIVSGALVTCSTPPTFTCNPAAPPSSVGLQTGLTGASANELTFDVP